MKILKQKDYEVYLISSALEPSVKTIADILGVEKYYGTTALIQDGVYTSELELILNFEEKHNLLRQLLAETKHEKHVGFGDSAGDIDMLKAMDTAIVYNPKSQDLVSLANDHGWFIANENNVLEFAQNNL